MRAVLDVNVIISALLSRDGSPARIVRACLDGRLEVIVSPLLLAELERALAYPRIRRRISAEEAAAFVDLLARVATVVPDPDVQPPVRSPDPGDDYLLALAAAEDAHLVSGDEHLLSVGSHLPIHPPSAFIALLERGEP